MQPLWFHGGFEIFLLFYFLFAGGWAIAMGVAMERPLAGAPWALGVQVLCMPVRSCQGLNAFIRRP